MATRLEDLMAEMVEARASDLFLKAGTPPCLRIDGVINTLDFPDLAMSDVESIAYKLMSEDQVKYFENNMEMDLAIGISGIGRFRVNVYRQRGSLGMVFRHVTNPDFTIEQLNLPAAIQTLAEKRRGLILVTGTTGSGKSTTLAAMMNHVNKMRRCHIVTIEDPIEFLHQDKMAIISQREVGFDTKGFKEALRHVLRQSPDVILIGEMRDLETIQTAISAAETGHLVLSTLHTIDSTQTVERIINFFPAYLHNQIRLELSMCLQGIVSMRLLQMASGRGRIPAVEVLIGTPTMKKLIYEGRTLELLQYIEDGQHFGMQSFNQSLIQLWREGKVRYEDALANATSPDEFRMMAEGIGTGTRKKEL